MIINSSSNNSVPSISNKRSYLIENKQIQGKLLTKDDIGKVFVRCRFYQAPNGVHDNSYIPFSANKSDLNKVKCKLVEITEKNLIFKRKGYVCPNILNLTWNDGHWISARQLNKKQPQLSKNV